MGRSKDDDPEIPLGGINASSQCHVDAESLQRGAKAAQGTVPLYRLFAFADPLDYLLLSIGTVNVAAVAHGADMPVFFLFFGNLIDAFGVTLDNPAKTLEIVNLYALYTLFLGTMVCFASWAEVAAWMQTGERQAATRNTYLFAPDTLLIQDDIRKREGATEQQVHAAAMAANAHNFISPLPDSYNTQVGERGVQHSVGQKQRVAIARAVLQNPVVLLQDEATSALDAESGKIVQEALDRLMQGRTSVVVARRLSTIRNAISIAIIQDGTGIEKGSHDSLLAKPDGTYAHLVRLQQHDLH